MNKKLYWTDRCLSNIEVYDPTTEHRRTLFNSTAGIRNPHGIVVDPTTGYGKNNKYCNIINFVFQLGSYVIILGNILVENNKLCTVLTPCA